jgi:hypothetical protein
MKSHVERSEGRKGVDIVIVHDVDEKTLTLQR